MRTLDSKGSVSASTTAKLLILAVVMIVSFVRGAYAQTITTNSLPGGVVGATYPPQALSATGGTPSYTWSITGSAPAACSGNPTALPCGLVLDTTNGIISGTPTIAETYNFVVVVTGGGTGSKSFSIVISTPLVPQATSLPAAAVGSLYTPQTLSASGGTAPYSWSLIVGSLPSGLTLSNGVISGTPTVSGVFNFTVRATDSSSPQQTANENLTIDIPPLITSTTLPNGAVNLTYSQTLAASPGATPFMWSLASGALPGGINLSSAGVLSGTPTASGTFTVTINVTDSSTPPQTGSALLSITIQPALTIATSSLPSGIVGTFYVQTLTATGPSSPTWSVASGVLPPGLSLAANGTLSGTPSLAGTFPVTIQAIGGSPQQTTTRTFQFVISTTLAITTTSLPNGAVGLAYSQTLTATGGAPAYTWALTSGSLPAGLSLSSGGSITGMPTANGTSNFAIGVTDSSTPTQMATQSFSLTVQLALSITTSSIPSGTVGTFYVQTLTAAGPAPQTWTVASGVLPPGISMGSNGTISGTPSLVGTFPVTIQAVGGNPQQTATATFQFVIVSTLTVSTPSLANAAVGSAYSQTLTETGGTAPYSWAVTAGALPAGLTLAASSGKISGTPTTAATATFTVTVTDSSTPPQTAALALSITTQPQLTINAISGSLTGIIGVFFQQTFGATGPSPVTWSLFSGLLPPGLNLGSSGVLSGSPSIAGAFNFTVQASAGNPAQTVTQAVTANIKSPLSITTFTTLPNGSAGTLYSTTLTASGGVAPYSWASLSALPPGLTLSSSGVLSGTPTIAGSFAVVTQVTDSFSPAQTAGATFNLSISTALALSTSSLPNAVIGSNYSQSLVATAGTAPYSFSVTSGTLPNGLTLSASGKISGTATVASTFNFTVTVTDSSAPVETASQALSIVVQASLSITTGGTLPVGVAGVFYSQTLAASGPTPQTWSVSSGVMAPGLTLSTNGTLTGTPSTPGLFTFTAQVAAGNPQETASQGFQVVINSALAITTLGQLPNAVTGMTYTTSLAATGGMPPYSWTAVNALPPGLSLSSDGVLSGTPTTAGNYSFVLQIKDSFSPAQTVTQQFGVIVSTALTVTTTTLQNGAVGVTYSQTLVASAGTPPYAWAVSAGTLPTGLSLSSSGVISGTPSVASTFNFTVTATDSESPTRTASQALTIIVQPALTITTATQLPQGSVGVFYTQTLKASLASQLTWTVTSSDLPPGLTLTSNGTINGIPAEAGSYNFTVQAVGGSPQQTATMALQLVINAAISIFTPATLPTATLSKPYSVTFTASGGVQPYSWTSTGPSLPAGLTLSGAGVLSGTPSALGNFTLVLQITDSSAPPLTVASAFSLTVGSPATITTTSLPVAIQNLAYSEQLQATGTAPFTYVISSGALPAGLSMNAAGLISGVPPTTGSSTFKVTVTDSNGMTNATPFMIQVDPTLPTLAAVNFPTMLSSTQQAPLSISLASPYPSDLSGQLTLTFNSSAEVPGDDPMTQFSNGSRTVSFTIPANTTAAVFPSPVMVLIGTVAGAVNLTANIQNGPTNIAVGSLTIPATPPQTTDITATLTSNGLSVGITGYAPARRITNATFTFTLSVGGAIQTKTLSEAVDANFQTWYASTASDAFGSEFSFVQSFTVSGGVLATIQSVTVQLTNAQGSSTSATVNISPQ